MLSNGQKLNDQNLIALLGIERLPEEQKLRILKQSADLIEQRLLLRLQKSMNEENQTKFAQLLEKSDPGQMDEFIGQQAPEFPNWIHEEIAQLKNELAGLANEDI